MNGTNGNGNGKRALIVLISSVMAGMAGSGSGVYVYMQNVGPQQLQHIARPDPATGTDLRHVRESINRHVMNHPDIVNKFDRRITRLEANVEIIIRNQNTIMNRLNQR